MIGQIVVGLSSFVLFLKDLRGKVDIVVAT
jgi:hypothetical protein